MDKGIALVLRTLEGLDVPPDIGTVAQRKHIQKAVYIAQAAGVPLGYEFNWYVKGPYSPELTRVYYRDEFAAAAVHQERPQLRADLRQRLENVREVLVAGKPAGLSPDDWMELVASWHFLRSRRRLPEDQATAVLAEQKPHVAGFKEEADRALRELALA
jgi:hypothetical protein